jgi:methionine-rich copper-binding protein CopC
MTVRRIIAMLAPVLLTGAAVIATAPSATAHASQVGSTPAADEVVAVAPNEVEIQFDSGLLEMGAALVVRSAQDESIVMGDPVVGENVLTVPVDPNAAPGEYEVAYRAVSADGHTIEGSFTYTLEGVAEAPSPSAPAASETDSTTMVTDEPTSQSPAASAETSADQAAEGTTDDSSIPVAAIALGVGIVIVLGIGGALLLRR